jgi:hypothetical protein
MRGLSRRTFAGMLAAAAPGSVLPAPRAPAILRPPWWTPQWSGWFQVPGGGSTISAPGVIALDRSDNLYLVVRGLDSGIYYNSVFTPTSAWSGWREIPGGGRTPSGPALFAAELVNAYDNLGVVVRDEADGIQLNAYDPEHDSWTGWVVVPGRGLTPSGPVVAWDSGWGEVTVFVRDTDNGIQYNSWCFPCIGSEALWQGWREIPGGGRTLSTPSVSMHSPGGPGFRTNVVVRGLDDAIYENYTDDNVDSSGDSTWSGWREIPGGGRTASGPATIAVDLSPAPPVVIVRGLDGGIYYDLRGPPRRGVPSWREIPGGGRTPSAPAVADVPLGLGRGHARRYVFIRGVDNLIYYNYYEY